MNALLLYSVVSLTAIWIAYPLGIRIVGALRRPRPGAAREAVSRTVSMVVASADDAAAVRARVADLLATNYPAHLLEVVVALDHAHAKATREELEAMDPRVRVVGGDAPGGKAATLNAGVRAARGDVLVFADTAQRFEPDAVGALVADLTDPRLGAVSGVLDLPGIGGSLNLPERYWRYERWLRRWEARVHSTVGVTGAIYATRRSLWSPLPSGLILDDVYVPMRLVIEGWKVGVARNARAHDTRRFAPSQEYQRKMRTLTGVIQVCAWLPSVLHPLRNPICVQFVFHKLLRLLTPYLVLAAFLGAGWQVGAYLLSHPPGIQLTLGMMAALCFIPRVRRTLKEQLTWGLAMQSSIVAATANGMRGRWEVWR
jgi:cellulose synthase/poly-beta-1,6-N-acetylglucosamine synthase-like glycosyltransferase